MFLIVALLIGHGWISVLPWPVFDFLWVGISVFLVLSKQLLSVVPRNMLGSETPRGLGGREGPYHASVM